MVVETVKLPKEIAFLAVGEDEQIQQGDHISEQDKLVYVCRGQDD